VDIARLERIVAQLAPADAGWLRDQFEPPWRRRQRRLAQRDAAVRDARSLFSDPHHITCAARSLSRALAGYRASNWSAEKDLPALPDSASERHVVLHAIARANGGRPLGWRRIVDIWDDIAIISVGNCNRSPV
jgi:hypothetical protein